MPTIPKSEVSLRISGDELNPEEITRLLGCEPDKGWAKGDEVTTPNPKRPRIAKFGLWSLYSGVREPADLDYHVFNLLDRLTPDLEVWTNLASRFEIELFSSLFMNHANEGHQVSARALRALGERGIELGLDVYALSDDD